MMMRKRHRLSSHLQYSILDNAKRAVLNDYVFILQRVPHWHLWSRMPCGSHSELQCMRANRDRRMCLRKRRAVATITKMYRAYKARSQYVKVLKAARKIQVILPATRACKQAAHFILTNCRTGIGCTRHAVGIKPRRRPRLYFR